MSRATTDIHAHRLIVAAHEIGHYLIWTTIPGARVVHVRLTGRHTGTSGEVRMNWKKAADDDNANHAFLTGLLAGTEAAQLWCKRTRTRPACGMDDSHDMGAFRRARRVHESSRQWSEAALRRDARTLLTARWSELDRLTHQLAARGRL